MPIGVHRRPKSFCRGDEHAQELRFLVLHDVGGRWRRHRWHVAGVAKNGDRIQVRDLIKQKSDVNAAEPDGTTALDWAAHADDIEMARMLIAAGAKVKTADRYGLTPLSLAAARGSARMLELLINAGADPNAALPEGETPLMTAAHSGNPEAVKVLLAHGADVKKAKENTLGETALMWAAAENHAEAVRVLLSADANINERSTQLNLAPFKWVTSGMVSTTLPRGGWTALMYAARQGAIDAARVLVDQHADINATDPDGTTALVIAIINAHYDLANMLLEKGADPNITDETGMAALYAAVDMHTLGPMQGRPAPQLVDNLNGIGLIKSLLAHAANPNMQLKRPIIGRHHGSGDATLGDGTTPLMRAAKANDIAVMKALLDAGADPFITQKDRTTVLMIAAAGGQQAGGYAMALPVTEEGAIQAIQLCLDRGVEINAFNTLGMTAMHRAAGRGADKVVKYLAEHGASLDMKNKASLTPLDMAEGKAGGRNGPNPHESTIALIRQLMGSETAKNN
jgi:ankyrin repeat protein